LKKIFKRGFYRAFARCLRSVISNYVEDILIISGLMIMIKATFLLSKIAGLYALGGVLLLLGLYFARNPTERS